MSGGKKILIAAGGTGGHIFPALAAAKVFQSQGNEILWVGTETRMEADLVPKYGYPIRFIPISALRGKGFKATLAAPWKIAKAIRAGTALIREVKPSFVLAMGGFVSGPIGIAAWISNTPLIIHEQNAVPGLTNQLLSRFSTRILTSFPGVFSNSQRTILTGNPVREELTLLPPPNERFLQRSGPLRVLVLGGSLGASVFNERLPEVFKQLLSSSPLEIWHQTGKESFETARQSYQKAGVRVKLAPFIEEMSKAYEWADFVIARAGALTVAEVATVGLGALFIPFPRAVDDHQTKNAQALVQTGGAICLSQSEATIPHLVRILSEVLKSRDCLLEKALLAKHFTQQAATQRVVTSCQEV